MASAEDWRDRAKALGEQATTNLVVAALVIARSAPNPDDDQWHVYWHLIGTMHERGGQAEFDAAERLVASADPIERELGCQILGQLGWSKSTFLDESIDLLSNCLGDPNVDVISAAAHALGHRRSPRSIEPALALFDHSSADVRHGIVFALSCQEDRRATDALIKLSRDPDRDVRDWATFGLGSMCTADYPELRAALRARLSETDAEILSEALEGLARRHDPLAVPALIAALETGDVIAGYLIAAEAAADAALLPALLKLKSETDPDTEDYWTHCLDDAIAACRPPAR